MNSKITHKFLFFIGALLLPTVGPVWADTDMQLQEKALKAREMTRQGGEDHSMHANPAEAESVFRGVFYGYLPCDEPECNGLKMTLSLNPKNKYLLVMQPAKPQNRESFEKGKYTWDNDNRIVTLIPGKEAPQRRLAIKDEATLLYLSNDGKPMTENQDRYLLQRSDKAGNREMHIH